MYNIYKTTNDSFIVELDKTNRVYLTKELTITDVSTIGEPTSRLRSDANVYQEIINIVNAHVNAEKRTIVDNINWFPVFVDKENFDLHIDVNWEIIKFDDKDIFIKLKQQASEVKKLKLSLPTSESNLFKLGDRVLLFGPTGTGKTYSFLDTVNGMIAKGELDAYTTVTITEWFEDNDFLTYLFPAENGWFVYQEKAVVELLRKAAAGMKVAVLLDELNRGSKSFLNLMLKLLDAVDGENYVLYNHFKDETIVIPQANLLFFATMNLWGKYVGTAALDEALFDRFNVVQYHGYQAQVEEQMYKAFGEFEKQAKAVVEHTRALNTSGEIRAPLSTRGIKVWAEKFLNTSKSKQDFFMTFNLVALFRLCWVDDFGNPNEVEKASILAKFKELSII